MKWQALLTVYLLGVTGFFTLTNHAHAQRGRGYPIPLGYRSPSLVLGIGYSTRYIYPTYDVYPYTAPHAVFDPVAQPFTPPMPAAVTQDSSAYVRVLVPDAQAKVWFDGALTTTTGTERLYHTAPLAPGGSYTYRIRAAWTAKGQEMIQELVVSVAPGRTTVADFTRPVPEQK